MPNARGFSLVETVVSIALLTGAIVALEQLVAIGIHHSAAASYRTLATIAAQHKIEQLRAAATLDDETGRVEHVDRSGTLVCTTAEPCATASFTVRWSVAPFAFAQGMVLIDVLVSHAHRHFGEVRLVAVRPRRIR
jgi:Tfp pilus assembly protein PilV